MAEHNAFRSAIAERVRGASLALPSALVLLALPAVLSAGDPPAGGRDLHVDPATGDDASDAVTAPVKTIARALSLAGPGDTVHLAPARYREQAVFVNKRGEPGRAITLDGHGAILNGAEPLDPAAWTMVEPGLFRHDHLLTVNPGTLGRWFFVWDGRMNRMGRTSKGPKAGFKAPADLQPGEWTYVARSPVARDSKDGRPWDAVAIPGAFYLRIDPARTLADYRIEAPVRASGVSFGGLCAHVAIRNLTATHFYNDGFNIHGDQTALVFENITAIECGDDGFSAHEAAECRIEGFTSTGNSTGLCDVGTSRTHYRNVFIRDCLGVDVYFVSRGEHRIENATVESSAARAVAMGRDSIPEGECRVSFRDVTIRRTGGGPQEICVNPGGRLLAAHCIFENLDFQAAPGSAVDLRHCRLTGHPKPALQIWNGAAWTGAGNHYDLSRLRAGQAGFTAESFAAFQKLTGSEEGSRWGE